MIYLLSFKDIFKSSNQITIQKKIHVYQNLYQILKEDNKSRPIAKGTINLPKGPLLVTKWAKNGVFVRVLRVVRFKKSTFWVQKVHILVVSHPPPQKKNDPGYGAWQKVQNVWLVLFFPVLKVKGGGGYTKLRRWWRIYQTFFFFFFFRPSLVTQLHNLQAQSGIIDMHLWLTLPLSVVCKQDVWWELLSQLTRKLNFEKKLTISGKSVLYVGCESDHFTTEIAIFCQCACQLNSLPGFVGPWNLAFTNIWAELIGYSWIRGDLVLLAPRRVVWFRRSDTPWWNGQM